MKFDRSGEFGFGWVDCGGQLIEWVRFSEEEVWLLYYFRFQVGRQMYAMEFQFSGWQSGAFKEQGVRESGVLDGIGDVFGFKFQCFYLIVGFICLVSYFFKELLSCIRKCL